MLVRKNPKKYKQEEILADLLGTFEALSYSLWPTRKSCLVKEPSVERSSGRRLVLS